MKKPTEHVVIAFDGVPFTYNPKTNRITDPGKFEGEKRYMPHFFEAFLNGMADSDDGDIVSISVMDDDKARFPELRRRKRVRFREDDNGFVWEV